MTSIYQSIYELIVNTVFGGSVSVGSPPEFIATLFSTFACCILISIPFVACWKIVKVLLGG